MAKRRFIERYFEPEVLNFVSIFILSVVGIFAIILFVAPERLLNSFGVNLGSDYICFYTTGRLPLDEIYNLQSQSRLSHQLFNLPADQILPFSYPPFMILPFKLLAQIPYIWSYLLWSVFSLMLYIFGLVLVLKSTNITKSWHKIIFFLALSFMPFIVETILGGQASAIGFFSLALAFYLYKRNRLFLSGLALGLCLYKPTLLIIILPLLIFTVQLQILSGFILMGIILGAGSFIAFGSEVFSNWFNISLGFLKATSHTGMFKLSKYIDIFSNYRLIFGEMSKFTQGFICAAGVVISGVCIWKADRKIKLALTLILTTIFNLYFPIYDSIILVMAALLIIDVCEIDLRLKVLLAFIYLTPFFTQALSGLVHFQVYSLAIAGLGIYLLREKEIVFIN